MSDAFTLVKTWRLYESLTTLLTLSIPFLFLLFDIPFGVFSGVFCFEMWLYIHDALYDKRHTPNRVKFSREVQLFLLRNAFLRASLISLPGWVLAFVSSIFIGFDIFSSNWILHQVALIIFYTLLAYLGGADFWFIPFYARYNFFPLVSSLNQETEDMIVAFFKQLHRDKLVDFFNVGRD
jgi:hypothetical protein